MFLCTLLCLGLGTSHIMIVVENSKLSMCPHAFLGVLLQFFAVLLCHKAMIHFQDACMDELSKHCDVLQKRLVPGNLLQCIVGGTSNFKPLLLLFRFSWDGWMRALIEMLTAIPVVDVGRVVHDGFPSFNTFGGITL